MTNKKPLFWNRPFTALTANIPSVAQAMVCAVAVAVVALSAADSASAQSRGAVRSSTLGLAGAKSSVRGVSDQDHARVRREKGQLRPFEELMQKAAAVGRGQYMGVEPNISNSVYRFKFMRAGGNLIWVDIDGRTGRVLAERQ